MTLENHQPDSWAFVALSQGQARSREFTEPYILISIRDAGDADIVFDPSPLRLDILCLQFDDIERQERGKTLFERGHARAILDFVEKNKDEARVIACHCKVGRSRSPAVVAALAVLMGCDDGLSDSRGRQKYRPNRHVQAVMLNEGRRHPIACHGRKQATEDC